MMNVTFTMTEDTLTWGRIQAARDYVSVSRYLGQLVEQARVPNGAYECAIRLALKFEPLPFPEGTRVLTRSEVHDLAHLR